MNKVLHFIRSVGLIKGLIKGIAQETIVGRGAGTGLWPTPHAFI
jgi:hypothetical protein